MTKLTRSKLLLGSAAVLVMTASAASAKII